MYGRVAVLVTVTLVFVAEYESQVKASRGMRRRRKESKHVGTLRLP